MGTPYASVPTRRIPRRTTCSSSPSIAPPYNRRCRLYTARRVPAQDSESRVHDVVEDRAERVAHAGVHLVLVAGEQGTTAEQHIRRRALFLREIHLIVNPGVSATDVDAEAAEQADAEIGIDLGGTLGDVVEVGAVLDVDIRGSPRLARVVRRLHDLRRQRLAELVEDGRV